MTFEALSKNLTFKQKLLWLLFGYFLLNLGNFSNITSWCHKHILDTECWNKALWFVKRRQNTCEPPISNATLKLVFDINSISYNWLWSVWPDWAMFKVVCTKFSYLSGQSIWWLLWPFKISFFKVKTTMSLFWANLKKLGRFYSNIW